MGMDMPPQRPTTRWRLQPLATTAAALAATGACAGVIDTDNPDLSVRWDNTIKYSLASRLKSPSPALLANTNNDDGDRNFGKGLISNRVDLFSELDVVYQRNWGARLSAAAWYDDVYNRRNDNPGLAGGAFPNQVSVPFNKFPDATRRLHGRKAELLDALVFGKFDIDGRSLNVRAGRHALLWGESLFFGANAIAGGQQPVDAIKLLSVPSTQFKEAIRPVPQISGQFQLNSNVSIGAYVQTSFERSRVPAVGSYFSNADPAVDGGESLLLGPGVPPALRQPDLQPGNTGQGGLQLRVRGEEVDYGFYAIRFHAKTPQVVPVLGLTPGGPAPTGYYLAYQKAITAFGASASKTFDNFNVAIEGSIRHDQDLSSTQGADLSGFTPAPRANITDNPGYAVGKTAHINISTLGSLGHSILWREASLAAEVAWNRVLSISKNAAAADPNAKRDGVALRFVLEPTYRSVFDGVDIGVPLGMGWAPKGSRPLAVSNPNAWIPEGGGDVSIGLNASFHDAWRATLTYTHYFGPEASFNVGANNAYSWRQTFKDRDFIAASLRYSF
jgi:hypothetical protein